MTGPRATPGEAESARPSETVRNGAVVRVVNRNSETYGWVGIVYIDDGANVYVRFPWKDGQLHFLRHELEGLAFSCEPDLRDALAHVLARYDNLNREMDERTGLRAWADDGCTTEIRALLARIEGGDA